MLPPFSTPDSAPRTSARGEGTATAELALLLPMILLLVMGALEFGHVFQAWVVVNNAAREGARYAAVGMSANDVRSGVVLTYLEQSGLGASSGVQLPSVSDIQVSIDEPGGLVTVHVPVWVEIYAPIVANLLPSNPLRVGASTTMRRQ